MHHVILTALMAHHHAVPSPKPESLGQSMADFAKAGPRAWLVLAAFGAGVFGLLRACVPSRNQKKRN